MPTTSEDDMQTIQERIRNAAEAHGLRFNNFQAPNGKLCPSVTGEKQNLKRLISNMISNASDLHAREVEKDALGKLVGDFTMPWEALELLIETLVVGTQKINKDPYTATYYWPNLDAVK